MNYQICNTEISHKNNLDLIRFFLAACVCFTHSYNLLYGDNTDPLGLATGVIGLGGTAVDMFFLISGFLVCQSWMLSKGFKPFILKRILRIYPGFIAATLASGLIFAPLVSENLADYFEKLDFLKFIRRAFQLELPGIPDVLANVPFPHVINGSLWTIKYEFVCYLLIALLGYLSTLQNRKIVLGLFLVIFGTFIFQSYFDSQKLFLLLNEVSLPRLFGKIINWPRFATFFLSGTLFYLYRDRIIYSRTMLLAAITSLMLLVFVFRMPNIGMPLFGSYALFYFAFSKTINASNFSKYGDFSYGLYLYAFPVQQLLVFYYRNYLNGIVMFVISFTLTLVLAVFSWYVVEKPFLKLKPRRSS